MHKALITGITGQIGSYLAEYLLERGYEVHGLDRRKSVNNHINLVNIKDQIKLIEGDITDPFSVLEIVDKGKYDEIYNLCAQSHVATSFKQPMLTYNVNTSGVVNLLEAMRKTSSHTRMYQASTSEMFGSSPAPQNEQTTFHPRSPYGVSKLAAHWYVTNYHESYHLQCACGIMFNTESPRRGDLFVTKKIINWVKAYKNGSKEVLELGNLDAKRDWSHALDSVDAIYRICNQDHYFNGIHGNKWQSYAFGSGKAYSVRDFLIRALEIAFNCTVDEKRFVYIGEGVNTSLFDMETKQEIMKVSAEFYRPAEVDDLRCDATKIKNDLGWETKHTLDDIIKDMLK
jgi:GDPmannose 4,6-dehydratase